MNNNRMSTLRSYIAQRGMLGLAGALWISASSFALAQSSAQSNTASDVPAASASHPSSLACPIDLANATRNSASTPALAIYEDKTCLLDVRQMKGYTRAIYDLRERTEFLQFHIPGASSMTVGALATMSVASSTDIVVYDSGKFSSDAFLLCDRLRKAGVKHFKILDGGIAAWSQWQHQPEKLLVSRLSDQEISAALLEPSNTILSLTPSLQAAIKDNHLSQHKSGTRLSRRTLILADESMPIAKIDAMLDGGRRKSVFFWLGSKERLKFLLTTYIAQNNKRLAGPAESSRCAAL